LKIGQLIKLYCQENNTKFPEEFKEHKNPAVRRAKILARVFEGQPKDYDAFQEQHSDLNIGQLIQKYTNEKGIPAKRAQKHIEKSQNKDKIKLEKLSSFFGKPEEHFTDLVSKNQGLNFMQLLEKLKAEEGVEIDQERLREFRREQQAIRKCERQDRKGKNSE